ncbi:FG-GAP-like repeat-containing protein [Alteromonas sp. 14N.309.X.WAT.G.H12]|uniref:FG-GAP-like repeat-containing protein n=1 Tax=Alteromonas sp. 14N.309.X.WAT.G.H12 TaxID=3120824 RepID=UPI002FD46CB8
MVKRQFFPWFGALLGLSAFFGQAAISQQEEQALQQLIQSLSKTYDFTIAVNTPSKQSPMYALGMELFFSKSLSGNQDVACASCHHPYLAGGDGLSLPVGEAPYDDNVVGLGRWHNWQASHDPKANGAPNVARHSQTTFNASLYNRSMFYDGRIFVLDRDLQNHGKNQAHRTPDSHLWQGDMSAGQDLLATQVRFPVVSTDEMRGHSFAAESTNEGVRDALINRLKQDDREQGWLDLFRRGFNAPNATSDTLITFDNIEAAISYYQSTQIFIDNPWFDYLQGNHHALTVAQKRGALLFFQEADKGGAGCISCHTPPTFTDEKYHNLAIPQFGRGKQPDGEDFGRRGVTQQDGDRYGFRTPSLLNVAETAPYTHTGAFYDLASVIKHHLDPAASIENYDFTFSDNPQLTYVADLLSNSRSLTQGALVHLGLEQKNHTSSLPQGVTLSESQINDLIAFLYSLTDPCVTNKACLSQWIPAPTVPAPDGHRLVAQFPGPSGPPQPVADALALETLAVQNLSHEGVDGPIIDSQLMTDTAFGCASGVDETDETLNTKGFTDAAREGFEEVALNAGLTHRHHISWQQYSLSSAQRLIFSGGVAGGDVNGDCWPDIFYVTGDGKSDVLYRNDRNSRFTDISKAWGITGKELSNGVAMVDIDGDGDLDIMTSNLLHDALPSLAGQQNASDPQTPTLYLNQNNGGVVVSDDIGLDVQFTSWSFAFADHDKDGDIDILTNHWRGPGLGGEQPNHLWENTSTDETLHFTASDGTAGLINLIGGADFTFTSNFSDINNDGWLDLLFAADFETSQVYQSLHNGQFKKVTNDHEITDKNGMGAAIADYDNDGYLDWFVTSIWDPNGKPEGSWGTTGNRLYRNNKGQLTDVSAHAGIENGLWAWGACFADFNNDGWLDLFHVNGFDLPLPLSKQFGHPLAYRKLKQSVAEFERSRSRLFISNQDGTFSEQGKAWGINDTLSGRGVVCMDYDRDGDVDILVSNHQDKPLLYRNRHNDAEGDNFLSITLRTDGKNSRALGAKVYVTTGDITQLQEVHGGGSFLSSAPSTLHFGLGSATVADKIVVKWPDNAGSISEFSHVKGNQFLYIKPMPGVSYDGELDHGQHPEPIKSEY